ncbi:MAG TPA: hypothetical protein HPP77_09405 [Candidatus Hydrogenedentes bacterium]|nr:hypothetical protein [Candidatus Hydrogenedentota bacterium]
MIDEVSRAVVGAGIGHPKGFLEFHRNPHEVGAFRGGPGPGERRRQEVFRHEDGPLDGVFRVGAARLLDDMVRAVDLVVPRAPVPVVVPSEIEDAWALDIEGYVEIIGLLVQEMAGVGALVSAGPVVGAAHIGSRAYANVGPSIPHTIRIQSHGNYRRLDQGVQQGDGQDFWEHGFGILFDLLSGRPDLRKRRQQMAGRGTNTHSVEARRSTADAGMISMSGCVCKFPWQGSGSMLE